MNSITVSFVLPVYNVEKYIRQCMDSILMQSLTDYEIILVNDGSRDGSLAICREYEAGYAFIHVYDQVNRGVAAARNVGLNAARGKYICFMDADDFYTADFAENFYETCEQEKLDVIRGFYRMYDEDIGAFREEPAKKLSYYDKVLSGSEFLVRSIKEKANEVVPVGGFFRREYLLDNQIRFPEGVIFEEDQIFFLEALLKQPCRIMQTAVEFYAYRKRSGSATTTFTLKHAQDVAYIVGLELAVVEKISDAAVRKAAKCYAGSSFFQLTCIYGWVENQYRTDIRRLCSFQTKLGCVFHAATAYQQLKIALFTFCPWVVNLVYDMRK